MALVSPTTEAEDQIGDLLQFIESRRSNILYDGTSPRVWAAAADYVDSYIRKDDKSQTELSFAYEVEQHAISKAYRKLITVPELSDYYGSEVIVRVSHLGPLLAQLRLPERGIGIATSLPTSRVKSALSALDRYDDEYELIRESKAGRDFITTERV